MINHLSATTQQYHLEFRTAYADIRVVETAAGMLREEDYHVHYLQEDNNSIRIHISWEDSVLSMPPLECIVAVKPVDSSGRSDDDGNRDGKDASREGLQMVHHQPITSDDVNNIDMPIINNNSANEADHGMDSESFETAIEIIRAQTDCTHEQAIDALVHTSGDIFRAIVIRMTG
jgi:NACalpha-BTF3-like transcription factor